MNRQSLSEPDTLIERSFDQLNDNPLQRLLGNDAGRCLMANQLSPSSYDLYPVRRNASVGDEVLGPKQVHVGNYSPEVLYGSMGSPIARFRTALRTLADRVHRLAKLDSETVEFAHQTTLFWAEVGGLKEFIGVSPVISEIVAELRTARFQFLGKDTPLTMIKAMADAIGMVAQAPRLDAVLVDAFVEKMEKGGFDSLVIDALRPVDA